MAAQSTVFQGRAKRPNIDDANDRNKDVNIDADKDFDTDTDTDFDFDFDFGFDTNSKTKKSVYYGERYFDYFRNK